MNKPTALYPRLHVDEAPVGAAGQAGGVLLTATGLARGLRTALAPWRRPLAVHDPAKVILDLAVAVALGGDALADAAVVRSEPGVYGPVASEAGGTSRLRGPISRTIAALAKNARKVERAVAAARKAARQAAWQRAGTDAPNHEISATNPVVVDIDATIILAHSQKEAAAPTFKKTYGFHPLVAFVDHGPGGAGEPLTMLLRKGNAGSNTAADHITVARTALKALPGVDASRPGKKVLVRTDGAGGTHGFLDWLHARGVQYSVGFTLPATMPELYALVPESCWQAALDADGDIREGAALVEITDLLAGAGLLKGYPPRMRVIVRRERPHPGAQLRFDDVDGYRLTAFATNTARGQLAELELRHRRRARCRGHLPLAGADRIRIAKDTGLANLPLQGFDQNRVWLGDRPARPGPDRLDPADRAARHRRSTVGTQAAAATRVLHRRDPRQAGSAPPAPHQDHRPLGGPGRHRARPARRGTALTPGPHVPDRPSPSSTPRHVEDDDHRGPTSRPLSHPH